MKFPFKDEPNTATLTCCHVIEDGSPILYASHDENDGMWQFLCGGTHDESDARIVSLYSIYVRDRTIADLANMPCGCVAERKGMDSAWRIDKESKCEGY